MKRSCLLLLVILIFSCEKNISYSDKEVREIIAKVDLEYKYDPNCEGNKDCQTESYGWRLYYSGKPDFID